MPSVNEEIDDFIQRQESRRGEEIREHGAWNNWATPDQVKHFLNGLGDLNERWHPDKPGDEVHPTYLTSVSAPIVLGYSGEGSLVPLLGGISYEWEEQISLGDELTGKTRVSDVDVKKEGEERLVIVYAETDYLNNNNHVATAGGTTIWYSPKANREMEEEEDSKNIDRDIYQYDTSEIDEIESVYDKELDRLKTEQQDLVFEQVDIEDRLPTVVRGPLTLGDMMCWHTARGPTWGANIINYISSRSDIEPNKFDDTILEMLPSQEYFIGHYSLEHPVTGWTEKAQAGHEDMYLCKLRDLPIPFGDGIAMFSWPTILITNWMGQNCDLVYHSVEFVTPLLYGDTMWFNGYITDKYQTDGEKIIEITWDASNQLDEVMFKGESRIAI